MCVYNVMGIVLSWKRHFRALIPTPWDIFGPLNSDTEI